MTDHAAESDDPRITGLRFAKVLVWLIYALFVVALIILVLSFFLQLFNASATASFTEWVYRNADRVLEPFRGIFPTREIGESGSVIDFATLFAIVMYGILALVVHAFVNWLDTQIVKLQADQDIARREAAARAQAARGLAAGPTGAATPTQGYGTQAPGAPGAAGPGPAPATDPGRPLP